MFIGPYRWWYAAVFAVVLALCLILAVSCGDDDDGIVYDQGSTWFTTTSPTGVSVECYDGGGWGWCREVDGG